MNTYAISAGANGADLQALSGPNRTVSGHVAGSVDPVKVALAIKMLKVATTTMQQDFLAGTIYQGFSGLA